MKTDITEAQVREKLIGLDEETQKNVVCALVGHSNVLTFCFGYHHCARCSAMLGDSLAGAYRNADGVYVGHDCAECRANADRLTWKDTLLTPDPFPVAEVES
jgi:hypothetical protein